MWPNARLSLTCEIASCGPLRAVGESDSTLRSISCGASTEGGESNDVQHATCLYNMASCSPDFRLNVERRTILLLDLLLLRMRRSHLEITAQYFGACAGAVELLFGQHKVRGGERCSPFACAEYLSRRTAKPAVRHVLGLFSEHGFETGLAFVENPHVVCPCRMGDCHRVNLQAIAS